VQVPVDVATVFVSPTSQKFKQRDVCAKDTTRGEDVLVVQGTRREPMKADIMQQSKLTREDFPLVGFSEYLPANSAKIDAKNDRNIRAFTFPSNLVFLLDSFEGREMLRLQLNRFSKASI
jgi:hypothetical protein